MVKSCSDEEMEFQFLDPRSTVFVTLRSKATARDTIVVLADGRHCCIELDGVGFAGPDPIFGTFFGH